MEYVTRRNRDTNAPYVKNHSRSYPKTLVSFKIYMLTKASCSVACSKLHKPTHSASSDAMPNNGLRHIKPDKKSATQGNQLRPLAGTQAAAGLYSPFSRLEASQELQALFKAFPDLRSQLRDIHAATLPPPACDTDGKHFGDHSHNKKEFGLGRVGRGKGPWTQDHAMQSGICALHKAKHEYGKRGEGVREYSDLVLRTLLGHGNEVHQEIADENAKLISQLLNSQTY